MRVDEAVGLMTKTFLHRIIDSFTKDLGKGDEEKSRELILRNMEELIDPRRVARALGFEGIYSEQILLKSILAVLANALDHTMSEDELSRFRAFRTNGKGLRVTGCPHVRRPDHAAFG